MLEVGQHGYQSFLPPAQYQSDHPDWFVPGFNVFDISNACLGFLNGMVTLGNMIELGQVKRPLIRRRRDSMRSGENAGSRSATRPGLRFRR